MASKRSGKPLGKESEKNGVTLHLRVIKRKKKRQRKRASKRKLKKTINRKKTLILEEKIKNNESLILIHSLPKGIRFLY